jgi:predicted Zn-dependent protease
MELSVLALQATTIALWAIDKVSGGALEKAGADVLEFLTRKFQGRLQIKESKPELLEAAILSEAEWDKDFQESLEKLIKQYQKIQSSSVSQSTESGVNINVGENPGTVIGQQIGQQFFR